MNDNWVRCPKCGAAVFGEQVEIKNAEAKCPKCEVRFGVTGGDVVDAEPVRLWTAHLEPPEEVQLFTDGSTQKFTWPYRRPPIITLLVMAISMVMFAMQPIFDPRGAQAIGQWSAVVAIIWVFIGYGMIVQYLNSTTMIVSDGWVTVRHGPLPWYPTSEHDLAEVSELFLACAESTLDYGQPTSQYSLAARLVDGTTRIIAGGQDQPLLVWYLKQELEKSLAVKEARQ